MKIFKKNYLKNFKILIYILITFFIFSLCKIIIYIKQTPKLNLYKINLTNFSKIYDKNNNFILDFKNKEKKIINQNNIPILLKNAIISTEDKRFYKHKGLDFFRILSSLIKNIINKKIIEGGSTLTQQLIKFTYFSTKKSDQTFKRKIQEAYLAIQLEKKITKDQILTYYINNVYMSNGLYGMNTAAINYFGKDLKKLNLAEISILVGMLQAPNRYNPYISLKNSIKRKNIILKNMLNNKKISKKTYKENICKKIILQPLNNLNNRKIFDNYIKEVINEVIIKTGENPFLKPMHIYTNIDTKIQKFLFNIINTNKFIKFPDNDLQVAITIIDVKNGKILSQIGGRNIPENVQLGNNLAVNTSRDLGSTVKPLTVYAPAIEEFNYSSNKILYDVPTTYMNTNINIQNADNKFFGPITMRNAIIFSRNTTAIKLFEKLGINRIQNFLNKLDIKYKYLQQSNAISSNTNFLKKNKYGISTLKLAAAYAAFANNGIYSKPNYVNKIIFNDGTIKKFNINSKRVMSDSTAYIITDILKDVINKGTAKNAFIPGVIQAGKTGTSNYNKNDFLNIKNKNKYYNFIAPDISFVGYTPKIAIAIWIGYNNHFIPIQSKDWNITTNIYKQILLFILKNYIINNNIDWNIPDNLIKYNNEVFFKKIFNEQYIEKKEEENLNEKTEDNNKILEENNNNNNINNNKTSENNITTTNNNNNIPNNTNNNNTTTTTTNNNNVTTTNNNTDNITNINN